MLALPAFVSSLELVSHDAMMALRCVVGDSLIGKYYVWRCPFLLFPSLLFSFIILS